MEDKIKYKVEISWSNEDNAYVAFVPQLPGCMAHGSTYNGALDNIKVAMELWLETAAEMGRSIPEAIPLDYVV